ncbi:PREDICTED: E3 ubiquitin-protein ligase TRAIP-like [Wasmannia auropunctata]|uniref:E3 ubiquitin-protein ligase TRAIP-like n=1 Tax=Wasmannia auropunctata TaxID=64793 RepID=UPI0005EF91BB|nr:PREDICTED: E3 ubiquitin-protein ligase TRAIP-like [Wasmannia auropunctata]
MKIFCTICHDLLAPTEDIFFTHCGHVFHHRCLFQWFERSEICPQCCARTTKNRIYKAYFTVSNNEDNLQERINGLKLQDLLNERNIRHYTSKNAVLKKQNADLRLQVRLVENKIRCKNSIICHTKNRIRNLNKVLQEYEVLKKKLSEKKREVKQFREIYKTPSVFTFKDLRDILRTHDRNSIIHHFFHLKEAYFRAMKLRK